MFLGIGYSVPFTFLGFAIGFIIFAIVILIIVGIKDLFENQDVIW